MKWLVVIISFINGAFMLFDGIFVQWKGKYIGPEKPGPWAFLFEKLGINVFKLGPLFMVYGILWLVLVCGLFFNKEWVRYLIYFLPVLTLWYLTFGTLISLIVLSVALFSENLL